jgi:uncharacterized membrane protein (DUF4010 family)
VLRNFRQHVEPFITLAFSLGFGLLIGLQRQRIEVPFGGIRTFPLISLFGTFCGMLGDSYGEWIIAAGVLTVFGTLALSSWAASVREKNDQGQTTEIAALLTFAIGAYLPTGDRSLAAVATGMTVLLLHLKDPMHVFVRKMGEKDMAGIMQFIVISLIILPLLPNRTYGPFHVLNPFDIWRMVVFIVGLSLAGYVLYKLVGRTANILLGGILGGLISSTATTISYARRARETPAVHMLAVTVILIASAVSYLRVLVEVSVIAPSSLNHMLPPLGIALVWSTSVAAAAFLFFRGEDKGEAREPSNPAELKSALVFGGLYALVTFIVAAVQHYFQSEALYAVAIVSGLTDMDAITLSLSRMVETNHISSDQAWRLILVASLANFVFKGCAAAFLGGWKFGMRLAPFIVAAVLGGVFLVLLWPAKWAGAQ